MIRKLSICFAALCIISMFSGCGAENSGDDQTTQSNAVTTNKVDDTTETAEITQTTATDTENQTETNIADTTDAKTEAPVYLMLYVDDNAKLIDDPTTNDLGGSGNPIQFVENSGVGYSSLNDIVYFENVDFGAKGTGTMTIFFANGNRDGIHSTLSVYIDDYESTYPVAEFDIKYTGGWDESYAKQFTVDCAIPSGTHTLYIQFTNENSGSFTWVSFTEAE